MELLAYFRAILRRWWLIVICIALGAGLGWASTLFRSEEATKGRTYYKATNTLVLDNSRSDSSALQPSFTNLDQIAILVTTGDVPNRVAEALRTEETGRQLAEKIVTTTNALTSTLDITATDPNAEQSVKLADEFSKQLLASLEKRDQDRYDAAIADLNSELATLKTQSDQFVARLASSPPDADIVRRQYDATQNTYYSKYGDLQKLVSSGPATTSMAVLESAESQPIGADEYGARLRLGALGQNHLRADFATDAASGITGSAPSTLSSPVSRTFVGGFLGLLIGLGLALLIDRLDRRIRTREEAEETFGLPVLAEVPKLARNEAADDQLVSYTAPHSRAAEAFRAVRTSLVFQQNTVQGSATHANGSNGTNGSGRTGDPPDRLFEPRVADTLVIMVTSASPREGKSTTSANLAVAFAEADASVLVVNCDFRRPTIHRRFRLNDEPRRVQDTPVPGVKLVTNVLPDPHANPSQVVAAQRQVIAAARGRFDVIILDTAPLLTANDGIDVVGSADLVLLVAQAGMSSRDSGKRVVDLLARVNAPLAGVVLVATGETSNDYYYYYQDAGRTGAPDAARTMPPSPGSSNGNSGSDIFGASAPADDPAKH